MRDRKTRALWLTLLLAAAGLRSAAWAVPPNLLAAYDGRRQALLRTYEPHLFEDHGDKPIGYDTLAWTALHGCGGPGRPQAMLDAIKPPTRDFARPPLVRYLFQYGSCLSDAQKRQLIAEVLYPDQLFKHGTLNHAVMSSTSYYLLAEHDPTLTFTDTDGHAYTAAEVAGRYKALLMSRFRKFTADGLNEQLSPTYAAIDIYPLLNLVDFARDGELRSAAERMAVAEIAILRADSFDGALMPPLMRENAPGQLSSNPNSIARDLLWLYYGGFGPLDGKRPEPIYGAMLATSNWRPPLSLLAMAEPGSAGPYEISVTTPNFALWDTPTQPESVGGARIEKGFAIGAGDIFALPDGDNDHTVAFRIMLRGLQPVGVVDCYQPYYQADQGEDAWAGDLNSPFQQSWRSGRRGLLLYDIPAEDPYLPGHGLAPNHFTAERAKSAVHLNQLAECRLPRAADALSVTSHGVFARYGGVFLALQSLSAAPVAADRTPTGDKLRGFMTLKVRAPRVALYYRVEPARPGETLAEFARMIAQDHAGYDERSQTATVPDAAGQRVQVRYTPYVFAPDKRLVPPAPLPSAGYVAASPSLRWSNGQVVLSSGPLR